MYLFSLSLGSYLSDVFRSQSPFTYVGLVAKFFVPGGDNIAAKQQHQFNTSALQRQEQESLARALANFKLHAGIQCNARFMRGLGTERRTLNNYETC